MENEEEEEEEEEGGLRQHVPFFRTDEQPFTQRFTIRMTPTPSPYSITIITASGQRGRTHSLPRQTG